MNTTPHTFNSIANKLKRENVFRAPFRYHYPTWAKHGDACIDIGLIGTALKLRAKNHDPQHEVYGVSLQFSQASGDARRSEDLPAQPEKETQLAYATEQCCLADADVARIVQEPQYLSQSTPAVVPSVSQDPPAQRENVTQLAHATEQRLLGAAACIVQKPPDSSPSTASLVASGSQNPLPQQVTIPETQVLVTQQQDVA